MLEFLKFLFFLSPAPEVEDGFGQTLAEDVRYWFRSKRCRRLSVVWRAPDDDERRYFDGHPVIGRFGDWTYAVTVVDGRRWVARNNYWFGFPDAAQFAFFVLEGEAIWAVAGFDVWPPPWALTGGLEPI